LCSFIEVNARRRHRIEPYYFPRTEAFKLERSMRADAPSTRYAVRYLLYLSPTPIRNYI